MAPRTKGLSAPKQIFSTSKLALVTVDPNRLVRISTHNTGEPFFNCSGKNRFDDPNPNKTARYGTCYFGFKLSVALAETSRHLNTDKAVVLFDRAKSKIQMDTATPLPNYPGFARAAKLLGIKGV